MFRSSVLLFALMATSHALFYEKPQKQGNKTDLKAIPKTKTANPLHNKWCMYDHVVPSVFLVGFQKAGTSSMWDDLVHKLDLLKGCGEVGKPCKVWGQEEPLYMKKELHFFDDDARYEKGMRFYAEHFPQCSDPQVRKDSRAIDATPNYITGGKETALRIWRAYNDTFSKSQYNEMKHQKLHFVIMVRNPAKRMEAGYWHFMKKDAQKHAGDFEEYVDKTLDDAKVWVKNTSLPEPSKPNPYHGSLYGKWLSEWLQVFDGSQFSVITLEEYTKTPQKVAHFLNGRMGQDKVVTMEEAANKHEREHPKMKVSTMSTLENLFEEDQKLFSKLVKQYCMAMECKDGRSSM